MILLKSVMSLHKQSNLLKREEEILDIKTLYTIANSLNVSSDYLIGRIDTPVPESTVVGNLISELTTEEVIYLVSILSRYVEILKKAGTDRNENSSV